MKITFVIPCISIGGGVRVVFEYANRLQARGHEVNIVYPLVPLIIKPSINVKDLVYQVRSTIINVNKEVRLNWFDLKCKLIRIPVLYPKPIKYFENLIPDADVIVATSWETAYSVNKFSEKKGKKYYFIQHYEIWDLWNDTCCWDEAKKIESNPEKMCLAMADIVPNNEYLKSVKNLVDETYKMPLKKITISSWLRELIETKMHEKVENTIINGVNFELFYKEFSDKSENNIQILIPNRNFIWKGTDEGVKALSYVKEKYPQVKVIMYGSKQKKPLPEWVKLYEQISDNELRNLYNSSEIFVLPSFVEGCQLPPMEAMACGCAVVATNVGGVPDYSINEKTIISVPPRNTEKLAEAIIRLIENESERKKIAENGYNYIKQFTWEKATDNLENCFITSIK